MSLNGSGVFSVNSAGQPVVSGTLITAAAFNAAMQDIATALSTALYKDGQQLNAANQAMGGFKLTGLAAGSTAGDSVRYEQVLLLAGGNMTGGLNGKLTTVASHATTADIFATTVGNLIDWTGTATTTAFAAAPQAGAERTLICAAAAVFTAGANMLIDGVASGQNLYCSAGDKVIVYAVTTTQFRLSIQQYLAPNVPVGAIIDYSGTSPPQGFLTCPVSQTNINRTTYAALFDAIGTTWGVGDGSTTFGMPWFAADYVGVQANANVGTASTGTVKAHTHTGFDQSAGSISAGGAVGTPLGVTGSTGGAANLAAGVRVLKCVKY
jgi:hypothetical protein